MSMDAQEPHAIRILVAGAGALGSVFGGLLQRAGYAVTLLGRATHLEAVAAGGLRIDGLWGDHTVRGCEGVLRATDLDAPFDAVLLTVKSFDTATMIDAVAPWLAPDGVVISLQNGLGNIETLAAAVGAHRVLGGRVIFGAEAIGPGHVRVTVYAAPVLIGAFRGGDARAATWARGWAERLAAVGIPALHCDDIAAALWGKVLYNAALNPLGALLGVHYGALSEDPNTRAIMSALIDETFQVAIAEGVRLEWPSAAAYCAAFYDRLVPATFHHRSSMLQDLERGRRTEIDAINGQVWQRGAAHGIVTPMNELLTRLVRARETIGSAGRR